MRIKVKVKPGASKNEIKQIEVDYFEIRTTVIPEKGKANEKVLELLSEYLKIPKSRIKLVKGEKNKEKEFEVV